MLALFWMLGTYENVLDSIRVNSQSSKSLTERHRRNDCIRRAMKMRQCGGLEGDGNTTTKMIKGVFLMGRGSFKAKPSDERIKSEKQCQEPVR